MLSLGCLHRTVDAVGTGTAGARFLRLFDLVWSKYSCGLSMVETKQAAKSFATIDRWGRGFGGMFGEEEHVAHALMRALLMIMRSEFRESAAQRLFSE